MIRTDRIVDEYTPSGITRHRIVRGKGPPELQFLMSWYPGWTRNPKLFARKVIRQHNTELDLFFVEFKTNWEPFDNPLIYLVYKLIDPYKLSNNIETFGIQFDNLLQEISDVNYSNIQNNELSVPQIYDFLYKEPDSDIMDSKMKLKKKKGGHEKKESHHKISDC